jgi:hypothetical protein
MEVLISLKQNSIVEEYKLRLSYYQIELKVCLILISQVVSFEGLTRKFVLASKYLIPLT